MKKFFITVSILLLTGAVCKLRAQIDPHFSQYYAYPLWLNPALTGVINGDLRVNANYKNQWPALGNPYTTGAVSVDGRPSEKVGLGLNIIDQAAGSAGYNYFAAYGSFSYGIAISDDGNQKIHFGVQAGIINRSFDPSKGQFGSQFNPTTGYDPNAPSFETFSTTSATVFDANAGVFYYDGNPLNTANLFGGFSVAHITREKDPFATDGINSKLPMRYTAQIGVRIKASDFFDIIPHALYVKQDDNYIKALGAYSELKFQDDRGLILGALYRFGDAAVANIGYHVDNYIIGASYDFNTSALRTATNSQGGIELSISYVFHKRVQEPEPVCPRL